MYQLAGAQNACCTHVPTTATQAFSSATRPATSLGPPVNSDAGISFHVIFEEDEEATSACTTEVPIVD